MLLTHDGKLTAGTITETESKDLLQIISDDNPSGGGFQFHDTTDYWQIVENYYRTGPHDHCSLQNPAWDGSCLFAAMIISTYIQDLSPSDMHIFIDQCL